MTSIYLRKSEFPAGCLPPVCILCSQAAEEYEPNRWDFVLLIDVGIAIAAYSFLAYYYAAVGFLVLGIIVWFFLRRRPVLWTPLCIDHMGYWTLPNVMQAMWLFSTLGAGIVPQIFPNDQFSLLTSMGLQFVFLILMLFFRVKQARVENWDQCGARVFDVDKRFADAVDEQRKAELLDMIDEVHDVEPDAHRDAEPSGM